MSRRNVKAGRLHFTTDIKSAVEQALVIFLAVGTPPKEDGSPDMSYYRQAAKDIAEAMNGYKVMVTKSTVPVGTGKWLREFVAENLKVKTNFGVASNPEFLREGAAIEDFMRPDRVVIGSNEEDAIAIMKDLYRPLYLIETPIVITSLEAAELIKYAANAFLATKITFINEIANLVRRHRLRRSRCRARNGNGQSHRTQISASRSRLRRLVLSERYRAFTTVADQFGVETLIVDAVIEANERQRQAMIPKIEKLVGDLNGKQIGVLGLSFKPETDDMRESPATDIIKEMTEARRAQSRLSTRWRWKKPNTACPISNTRRMNTMPLKTPTRWLLLPNGINFARSIWKKSKAF